MEITARLEASTVEQLLRELLPVTVILDDDEDSADRWIRIDPARSVAFVAHEGLLVEVGGYIRWRAAGVPVPLTINSAHLLLKPAVVEDADGGRLVFRPSLEKMDLKNVPDFLDSGITSIINKRLEKQGDSLAWHFGKTLRNQFPLSKEFVDVDSFHLGSKEGTVDVTADAIVFKLSLTAGFVRLAEDKS